MLRSAWVWTYAHGGRTFRCHVSGWFFFGASSSLLNVSVGFTRVNVYTRYTILSSRLHPHPNGVFHPPVGVRCRAGQHFLRGDSICGLSLLAFARALFRPPRPSLSVSGTLAWSWLGVIGRRQAVRPLYQTGYIAETYVDTGELSFEQVARPTRYLGLSVRC